MTMLVRNVALTGYLDFIRAREVDPLPLLRSVGLQAADLLIPYQWIALDAAAQLLELSADATGLEDIGIRLAENRKFTNLGPISVAAQGEPTIRDVLMLLHKYQHIRSDAIDLRVTEVEGIAKVSTDFNITSVDQPKQFPEMTIWALIRLIRIIAGQQWSPFSICFTHDGPTGHTVHSRVLGNAVKFGHTFNGFVFDAADLEIPNKLYDPLFRSFATDYVDTITSPRPVDNLDRIRELIETTLPTRRCSIQQVAKTLGVNRITVYRLLARNDTSFSEMVNTTRLALAERYVSQQTRTLTDISRLLGFSELSAFSRWFRSEFGSSPSVWRSKD
ncbi:MAG: AraC family transcriptional regulator [Rhodococcus sp. (in: high G+C Gram-positive bacteria)]|uniref:AraC family transcriptional regulator n=1 Tax=Rhodococcus sp. TaxID=1831 RepID=UPI0012282E41|nr:AraC family transcriptional regulator [Rhodococcus sp. (in: high G+C Gram-positive bacteria)]RZL23033.1 MAG: AraC family transcriptional regulator [Rhodococcus sp. (in: high G+C Gram-positive bacteria)]